MTSSNKRNLYVSVSSCSLPLHVCFLAWQRKEWHDIACLLHCLFYFIVLLSLWCFLWTFVIIMSFFVLWLLMSFLFLVLQQRNIVFYDDLVFCLFCLIHFLMICGNDDDFGWKSEESVISFWMPPPSSTSGIIISLLVTSSASVNLLYFVCPPLLVSLHCLCRWSS